MNDESKRYTRTSTIVYLASWPKWVDLDQGIVALQKIFQSTNFMIANKTQKWLRDNPLVTPEVVNNLLFLIFES